MPCSRRPLALVSATAIVAAGAFVLQTTPVQAADIIYVSPIGDDGADGSASSPVRTVTQGVRLAESGDTVQIASGVYHEQVQVYAKTVHLTAAPGAAVVFDGTTAVGNWSADGAAWSAPWQSDFARAGAPHTTAEHPEAGWPEQFFVDGAQLVEVASRSAVVSGTFYNDQAADRVVIGTNPAGRNITGSDLAWGIYLNNAHGSSISDVTVRGYATPSNNMAAIRAYADDLLLTDLTVHDNAYIGVSAIGANIAVDGVIADHNGYLGVHAHQSNGISVTDSTIINNNSSHFDNRHASGGIKVTSSSNVTVSGSTVSDNAGPGVWTDIQTSNVVVSNNLIQNNERSGIQIELSSDIVVAGNAVTDNGEAGVWILESTDAEVWNNAAFDNVRDVWVEEGPRADVFNVGVVNNILGGRADGAQAILNVDDWTENRSAADMQVSVEGNRYWLPFDSPTPLVSRWANWPAPLSLSATLYEHQGATNGDVIGDVNDGLDNPYVRNVTGNDFRQPAGAPLGVALTEAVASTLGADAGAAVVAGPLQAHDSTGVPAGPPPTTPSTTNAGSTSPSTTAPTPTTTPTSPTTTAPPVTTNPVGGTSTTTTSTTQPSATGRAVSTSATPGRRPAAAPAVRLDLPGAQSSGAASSRHIDQSAVSVANSVPVDVESVTILAADSSRDTAQRGEIRGWSALMNALSAD